MTAIDILYSQILGGASQIVGLFDYKPHVLIVLMVSVIGMVVAFLALRIEERIKRGSEPIGH